MSAIDIHWQVCEVYGPYSCAKERCGNGSETLRTAGKMFTANLAQADCQLSPTVWFLQLMHKFKKKKIQKNKTFPIVSLSFKVKALKNCAWHFFLSCVLMALNISYWRPQKQNICICVKLFDPFQKGGRWNVESNWHKRRNLGTVAVYFKLHQGLNKLQDYTTSPSHYIICYITCSL